MCDGLLLLEVNCHISLQFTWCKQEAANCILSLKPWQPSFMHGTERLQMSWSTTQDMRSKLATWLLYFNQSRSAWDKI